VDRGADGAEVKFRRQPFAILKNRPQHPNRLGDVAWGKVVLLLDKQLTSCRLKPYVGGVHRTVDQGAWNEQVMLRRTAVRFVQKLATPAPEAPGSVPLVGMNLGKRYRLLELIGQGGMGSVFRAEQIATRRSVALKLVHPELAHVEYIRRRFEREAQAASRLAHRNIVEVLDHGECEGHLFLAMELLSGRSLTQLLEHGDRPVKPPSRLPGLLARALRRLRGRAPAPPRQGLPLARALAIFREVLDALAHAHGRGVVHRDLKPDNIMLVPSGNTAAPEQVKLLDFGIAKIGGENSTAHKLTQAGVPIGTPHYMAPEQAAGETTDARSDIYSCGVILYEMLTGRCPFDADSAAVLLAMHLTAEPQSPRELAPEAQIPEALEGVILRALAKRREDRFASVAELRRALDEISPGPRAKRLRSPGTRRSLVVTSLGALALGALVLVGHGGTSAPAPSVESAPAPSVESAPAPSVDHAPAPVAVAPPALPVAHSASTSAAPPPTAALHQAAHSRAKKVKARHYKE
jgi:serine/threonine-protein kinase